MTCSAEWDISDPGLLRIASRMLGTRPTSGGARGPTVIVHYVGPAIPPDADMLPDGGVILWYLIEGE